MLMPALALALPLAAVIAQLLKSSLKEAMAQDYVMLARTKGFSESRVIVRDALRNAMLPTLTLTGVQLTFLIGGTVIIERIFSYEGLGNLAIDAVINRDLPLIQGIVLIFAVLFVGDQPRGRSPLRPSQPSAPPWLRPSCRRRRARSWRLVLAGSWLLIVVARGGSSPRSSLRTIRWRRTCCSTRLPPVWVSGVRARLSFSALTGSAATCFRASSTAAASRSPSPSSPLRSPA